MTSKRLTAADLLAKRSSTIHKWHRKYGPTVQIGPNEVSFADVSMVNEIYGQNTPFMKAPVYDTFALAPPGIFILRDKEHHRQRRRLLSHAFSYSNILDAESLMVENLNKFLNILDSNLDQPVDMLSRSRMLVLDTVGQ